MQERVLPIVAWFFIVLFYRTIIAFLIWHFHCVHTTAIVFVYFCWLIFSLSVFSLGALIFLRGNHKLRCQVWVQNKYVLSSL